MKPVKTWILIADGAHARLLETRGPDAGLAPAMNQEFAAPHPPTRAFGTDRPGRGRGPAGGTGHGFEPPADWHRFEKQRFARDLARVLRDALTDGRFDRLVLVAPPAALGALRESLDDGVRRAVTVELAKDLTHVSARDLRDHLREAVAF